jgi:oligoendopeptidase F
MGSFEEDSASVTMVLHELGHFYSDYILQDEASSVNDITEIHSQALELLVSDHYQEEFGETEGFMMQYDILHNAITTMVVQPYYAAIELRVYALSEEDLTLENINKIALEEGERFGQTNYYEGYLDHSWVLMPHIVNRPYSTLAYATSMSVALQIFEEYWRDSKTAIEAYEKIIHLEGGDSFLENVAHANLISPFAPGRMKQMADFARQYLLQEEEDLDAAA